MFMFKFKALSQVYLNNDIYRSISVYLPECLVISNSIKSLDALLNNSSKMKDFLFEFGKKIFKKCVLIIVILISKSFVWVVRNKKEHMWKLEQ